MSSYITNDLTTQAAAAALKAKMGLESNGYEDRDLQEIANEIRTLNTEATNYRYCENDEPIMPVLQNRHFTFPEMLAALKCTAYQMAEGEQFETHPLYLAMKEREERIEKMGCNTCDLWELDDTCNRLVFEPSWTPRFKVDMNVWTRKGVIVSIDPNNNTNPEFFVDKIRKEYLCKTYSEVKDKLSEHLQQIANLDVAEEEVVEELVNRGYDFFKAIYFINYDPYRYNYRDEMARDWADDHVRNIYTIKDCIDYDQLGDLIAEHPKDYLAAYEEYVETWIGDYFIIDTRKWNEE